MNDTDTCWTFNRDYDDLEQVAEFLPAFRRRLDEIEADGGYRYNDSFRGHIPGIEGPGEDTAIYLLQGLERKLRQDDTVERLLSEGYEWVDELDVRRKYSAVVLVPTRRMGGSWAEYRDARLVPRDGKPHAVLPKGARTRGYHVSGRKVLAR